jgi:hypothetical protein
MTAKELRNAIIASEMFSNQKLDGSCKKCNDLIEKGIRMKVILKIHEDDHLKPESLQKIRRA